MSELQRWLEKQKHEEPQPCNCIGPQNGQPLCPCRMKSVVVRNGRYILPEQDLGPVIVPFRKESP